MRKLKEYWEYCFEGDLDSLRTFYTENLIDIHNNEIGMLYACEGGHLHVLRWLWKLTDFHLNTDEVFLIACEYGHTRIAKWIWRRNPYLTLDLPFRHACMFGRTEIVKWIWSISQGKIILSNHIKDIVKWCEVNAYDDLLAWLHEDVLKLNKVNN